MSQRSPVESKREAQRLIVEIDERLAQQNVSEMERNSLLSVRKNLVAAINLLDVTSMMKDTGRDIPGSNEFTAQKLTVDLLDRIQQGARLGSSPEGRNGPRKGAADEGDAAEEHR